MAILPDMTQPVTTQPVTVPATVPDPAVPGNVTPDPLTQAPDGNITPEQKTTQPENNDGQDIDLTTFWDGSGEPPSDDPTRSPSASPGDSPAQPAQTQVTAQPIEQLQGILDAIPVADVMTTEIMEAVGNGDLKTFNESFKTQIRNSVKESLFLSAKMMSELQSGLIKKMDKRFADLNEADKSDAALIEALPFAADPAIRPIARSVFAQALNNTKGKREPALKMTRAYFKATMKLSAEDLDFSVAPRGEHVDSFDEPAETIDWAAEMLARS